MKKIILSVLIGCMVAGSCFAGASLQRVVVQDCHHYKIYKENGEFVGTVTVHDPAELNVYARKLKKGVYVFVETGSNSLIADRRIIVY